MTVAVYIVFAVAGLIILIAMLKTKRFLSALFLTAAQGFCALLAVDVLGKFFGVHLSVNACTLALSAFGGTPAVVMLLLADTMFGKL